MISPILWVIVSRSRLFSAFFLLLVLIAWTVEMKLVDGLGGVWHYELNLRCLFFFSLGVVMNYYAPDSMPKHISFTLIPLAAIMWYLYETRVDICIFIRIPIVCVSTLTLIAAVWSIVPPLKWPDFTRNSFPLFAVHGAILYLVPIPFKIAHCWVQAVDFVGPLTISLFVIVISLIVVVSLKKLFPRFASVIFGGR